MTATCAALLVLLNGSPTPPPLPPEVPADVAPPAGELSLEPAPRFFIFIRPLPTLFHGLLSTGPGYDALALPVGSMIRVREGVDLVPELYWLYGVESCHLSEEVCRPFNFLSLSVGVALTRQSATDTRPFFVLPKIIWTRYQEGARPVVSRTLEAGLEIGFRAAQGRFFFAASVGGSIGWGTNVSTEGSEYAIWSTWIRQPRTRSDRLVWNLDLNFLRLGVSF